MHMIALGIEGISILPDFGNQLSSLYATFCLAIPPSSTWHQKHEGLGAVAGFFIPVFVFLGF